MAQVPLAGVQLTMSPSGSELPVPRKLTVDSPTPLPYVQNVVPGLPQWQSVSVQVPVGFWWSKLPALRSRTAVGGLSPRFSQAKSSLDVPDLRSRSRSRRRRGRRSRSRAGDVLVLGHAAIGVMDLDVEMSLLEWKETSRHESVNVSAVIVAAPLPAGAATLLTNARSSSPGTVRTR